MKSRASWSRGDRSLHLRYPPAMPLDIAMLLASLALTWVMIMTGSMIRTVAWTPNGFVRSLGNRDDLPPPTPLAERADRAAKNMIENLVLFLGVLMAARFSEAAPG